jgi:small subunit ribosomal protein S14
MIERNKKRQSLAKRYASRRATLKARAGDESLPMEERFQARLKLAELPRNSAPNRVRNRCEVSGRPRGYYRKLRMSRIALRELSSNGLVPGMVKSSW